MVSNSFKEMFPELINHIVFRLSFMTYIYRLYIQKSIRLTIVSKINIS